MRKRILLFRSALKPSVNFEFASLFVISSVLVFVFFVSGCYEKVRSGKVGEKYEIDLSFDPTIDQQRQIHICQSNAKNGGPSQLFELAIRYARMGSFGKADTIFEQAIKSSPDDVPLLLAVGQYFEKYRRNPGKAIEYYRKASKLDTKLRDYAFYRLGFVHLRLGEVSKAIKIWKQGSENAKTLEIWLDCIDDLMKLHRNETAKYVLENLAQRFPDSTIPLEKMLEYGIGDSTKIMDNFLELAPFDEILDNYSRTYFNGKSLGDIIEVARNSDGLEKALAGHYIVDNCYDVDTLKYGVLALNAFADTPEQKIEFAEYLSFHRLYKYAYEVAVSSYSMAKSESDKVKMRLIALELLAKMDNLGIDAPLPKLFGGDEPDLLGGALSVLTDRNDVANFVRALQTAENKFYTQYRCQNLLENFIQQNPEDSLKLQAYIQLESIARQHLDYMKQIEYLNSELELTKKVDDRMEIYFRLLDVYGNEKKYSKMFDIADELFDRFSSDSEFASEISDIDWKLARVDKNSARNLFGKYFHKWLDDMDNCDIALENFLTVSRIYYNLLPKGDKKYFVKQYLPKILDYAPADRFWGYIAISNARRRSDFKALYLKYPFVPQYLQKYADAIVRAGKLQEQIDSCMNLAETDSQNIPLDLLAAELQYRASHFDKAYTLYRRVLSAKPGWRFLLVRVGELAHSLGDTAVAIDCYKKVITLEPDNRDYVERLGDILEQWHKNAEPVWNMLVYDNPLESRSWGELAAVYWDYLRYDRGVQTICDAREFFGDENLFAKELGALFDWKGLYDEAFEEYIHALKSADVYNTDEIASWLKKLFKHSGKPKKLLPELADYVNAKLRSPAVLTVFADLSLESGDTTSLVKKLSELAKSSKSSDVLDEVIRYADMLKETDIVVDANIRKAKIENSYYPMANAAYILAENGNFTKSIQVFNDLVSKRSEYRRQFARFLMRYKKYSDVAKIYQQMIADDSLGWENYIGICDAYLGMGNPKKARKILTDAIEMFKNTDSKKYKHQIKRLRIAIAKTYRDAEPNEALAAYERLLNKYPLDENILRNIWLFAREKKLVPKLIKYYEDVASKAAKNYRWDMLLWKLNRWQHNIDSARNWLAKACDNEPHRADIWRLRYNVAFVMRDFDDVKKSLAHLEKLGFDTEQQKIEYYLATGQKDSAYAILSKPIKKRKVSYYEYANVISNLIRRGMFDYSKDVVQLWEDEISREYDRVRCSEYRQKIAELTERPEEARNIIQNKLSSYVRNYHNNDWQISGVIYDFSDLAKRWHYLEDAIKSAESKKHSYWNDRLLEQLYTDGGDVVSLAKILVSMDETDDAIRFLYGAEEYDELAKICVDISSDEKIDIDERLFCAVARWHTGEQELARRILNSLSEFRPGNPYLFAKISRAYLGLGELENAEKFANLAISKRKYPDARIQRTLIDVKLARGDTSAAVKILTDIPANEKIPEIWRIEQLFKIGKDKIALKLLRKRWEYNDRNDTYYYYGGSDNDVLIRYKKYDILVDRLLHRAEKSDDEWRRSELILEAADDILNAEPERAVKIIQKYFGEKPENSRAKIILGQAFCKLKKYDRVIEIIEGIHSTDAMKILTDAYFGLGDSSSANDIVLSMLESRRDKESFVDILSLLIDNKQYELASSIGRIALHLWGGSPEIWLKSGIAFIESGNSKRGWQLIRRCAFQHYDKSVSDAALDFWAKESAKNNPQKELVWAKTQYLGENTPTHRKFDLLVLIAKILWESGRKDDAIDEAKKITVLFPNERDGFVLLEKFYRDAGIIEKADEVKKIIDTHFDFKSFDDYDEYY